MKVGIAILFTFNGLGIFLGIHLFLAWSTYLYCKSKYPFFIALFTAWGVFSTSIMIGISILYYWKSLPIHDLLLFFYR